MKHLGTINEWYQPNRWNPDTKKWEKQPSSEPDEYKQCRALGHKLVELKRSTRICWCIMTCPICNFSYGVDSSD